MNGVRPESAAIAAATPASAGLSSAKISAAAARSHQSIACHAASFDRAASRIMGAEANRFPSKR